MEKENMERSAAQIVDAACRVHREMGPGLLESVYALCLAEELQLRNVAIAAEVNIPLQYRGKELDKHFRIDLLVGDAIIIEIKSVDILLPVHEAQLISYLKLSGKSLGFLINFNVKSFREGIRRFVNHY